MKKVFIFFGLFLILISANVDAQRISGIDILGFAKQLFDVGLYQISLGEFQLYLKEHPESEDGYIARYYIGECYFQMNDYKNAAEQFMTLITQYPNAPNVALGWEGRGRSYENLKEFKKAAETFETAGGVFFYKGDVASPFFLYAGKNHLKYGNLEKAKENFLRIVNNYPGSDQAYEAIYQIGLIYLKERKTVAALKEFEKVKYVSENPIIAANSRLLLGKIYMKIGDYKKGRDELKDVINKYKDQIEFYNDAKLNLGILCVLDGSYKEGREILQDLAESSELSDSLIIRCMITVGESYLREENYSQAESEFSGIMDKYPLNPMTSEIFYNLGKCYELEENAEQALYSYRRSLEFSGIGKKFDDFQRKSLDKLVEIYEEKEEYKNAANYLKRFLNHFDGDSEYFLIRIADLYEKGADFLNAAEIYSILEREFSKGQNIDYYIYKKGITLERAGQYSEALKVFKKLINDYPGCDYTEDINFRISFIEESRMQDYYGKDQLTLLELINPESGKGNTKRAFELGKYYYYIRKFDKARSFFKIVLENGKDKEVIAEAAEYFSLSLDNTARRFYNDDDMLKYNIYLDSAFYAYGNYLGKGYFKGDILDKAKLRIAEISIEREPEEFEKERKGIICYETLAKEENFSKRDLALLRLGKIYMNSDSSDVNEIQFGRDYLNELTSLFPNSKYAENAKFEIGQSYYIAGEIDKASEAFKKYLIEYPNGKYTPAVTACLGKLALIGGDETESFELFRALSERFYYSSYVDCTAVEWGDFYFDKGNFKKAAEKYILALNRTEAGKLIEKNNIETKVVDLSVKIAAAYDSLKAFKEASLFLNDVIERNQNTANISSLYYALAKIYDNANYNNNAIEIYKKIEEEFPEEPFIVDILKRKSEILFYMERFADAREDYEKIATLTEDDADSAYYKSRAIVCLYRDNNITKGDAEANLFDKEFKELNERDFYKYQFLLEKGKAYYRSRNFNSARKVFDEVAKKGEKTELAPEAALYIGLIYQARKNKVDALKQFNSIIPDYPQTKIKYKIYNTLGYYYDSIGQVGDAARNFRMALESSPYGENDRIVMSNLIKSYYDSGWYDSELAALREYVKLFPEADDILDKKYQIGRALADLGDYAAAIENLKPILNEVSLESEILVQMEIAEAYEGMGNNEKAISEWLKVLYYGRSNIPKLNTTIRFRLASICERIGMYDKSLEFFEEIVRIEGATSDFGRPAVEGINRVKERIKSIEGYKNN